MRSSRRHVAIIGLIAVSMLLSACGSRRPLADFLAQSQVAATAAPGTAAVADPNAPQVPGASQTFAPGQTPLPGQTAGGNGPVTPGSGGGGTPGSGGGGGGSTAAPGVNFASDTGITATGISLGNVTTKSGGFGEDQFTPFYYGAAAFFNDVNAHGGINGRKVTFNFCDDGGNSSGDDNCFRRFIDDQKVFATVANTCLTCDGMKYASQKGVPMVGGVAIDFKDYALDHSYRYTGNPYPTGGQIGWKGKLYQPTGQYSFFKNNFGVKKAGVVYYDNSASSKGQGLAVAAALRSVGIEANEYPQNVALPNYDSAVADMKSRGVTAVWDSIDIGGNQNLCKSINANGLKLTAKVSTIAVWSQSVGTQFATPCRDYIYSVEDPGAVSYDQTNIPEIKRFRDAMALYFPDRESKLHQWSVDGWASAAWFTDAALSCGASLTRVCLEKYLSNPKGYAARGIWYQPTHSNAKINFDVQKGETRCMQVVKWDSAAKSFKSIRPMTQNCGYSPYQSSPAPL